MNSKLKLVAGLSLMVIMVACSPPATTPSLTVDEQAGTIIAATLTAQPANGTEAPATMMSSVPSTVTVTKATPTQGITATITPTYSTPMLTVLEQTNCREGPGQDYMVVFTYLATVRLEIIGRYDPTNYWLVKSPESKSGSCWLWGEYTELSGSYWVVPTLTPPPTATQPPPQAPSIIEYNYSCTGGNLTFIVQWQDRASNEEGYRIFRDGEAVAELPANSTAFTETIPLESGESVSYYIQVYGASGNVNSSTMKMEC